MTRLLCIGECMVEMALQQDGRYAMGFAGDTFNTAWYARRHAPEGLEVGYFSAVGDDGPSAAMAQFMADSGVTPMLLRRPGRGVGLYMISLKDGERSFAYWRDASAARTLADDLTELPVQPGDTAFFSGITLAILPQAGRAALLAALQKARVAGVRVVFDPNLRPRLWPDTVTMTAAIMQGAAVSDLVLPSFEDEAGYFGDADPEATVQRYQQAGVAEVVVKNGGGPVLVAQGAARETVTPPKVAEVVDSTAAGDSFNAGMLMAQARGVDLPKAVAEGCALAARVIGARGALVAV